ncbi:ABC transporter permease [Streptomyces sp. NPDC007856]|uniref:ABC transporter permease n=1 Tax=Streptomyces sp. NPDC007856 TaxID=3364781 RepID=UPI0036B5F005
MHAVRAGAWFQWMLFRRRMGSVTILLAIPFHVLNFLSVVQLSGRTDLYGAVVLAPALSGIWSVALALGSTTITAERSQGTLELLISSPASVAAYLWGRMLASTAVGLIAFLESWVFALAVVDLRPVIWHPGWFAAVLVATALATVASSAVLAAVAALSRTPEAHQNFLNYPMFVLAGIFTPVAFLPIWLKPVSRLIFLSWGADLFRGTMSPEQLPHPWLQIGAVVFLGGAAFVGGGYLISKIMSRLRSTGRLAVG